MAWMLGYDTVEELVEAIDGKVIQTDEGKLAIISACHDITSFVERHKKLEESNRTLNERNRNLSVLSRDYTTVLLCDLKQDTKGRLMPE